MLVLKTKGKILAGLWKRAKKSPAHHCRGKINIVIWMLRNRARTGAETHRKAVTHNGFSLDNRHKKAPHQRGFG